MKINELETGVMYYADGFVSGIRYLSKNGEMFDDKHIRQSEQKYLKETYKDINFTPIENISNPLLNVVYLDKNDKYLRHEGNIFIKKELRFLDLKIGDKFTTDSLKTEVYTKVEVGYNNYQALINNRVLVIANSCPVFLVKE